MKYDQAGNYTFSLNVNHGTYDYRIFNCNWRKQRNIISILTEVQDEDGNIKLLTETSIKAQDEIFSQIQLKKKDGKYVDLSVNEADKHIESVAHALALFNTVVEIAGTFLDHGRGVQSQTSSQNQNQIQKPSGHTSK